MKVFFQMSKSLLLLLISTFFIHEVSHAQLSKSALFVGNSYTMFNDMPKMVANIADSKGDTLSWVMSVRGGYSLKSHLTRQDLYTQLGNKQFDNVILQELHILTGYPDSIFKVESIPYIKAMKNIVRFYQPCANIYFTIPWAKRNGNSVDCPTDYIQCTYDGIYDRSLINFQNVKDSLNQPVIPLTVIWNRVRENYPWIYLYTNDSYHPNVLGSYLVACVNYAIIFHKSPIGGAFPSKINNELATILQNEAWAGVVEHADAWGIDINPSASSAFSEQGLGSNWTFVSNIKQRENSWWIVGDSIIDQVDTLIHTTITSCPFEVSLYVKNGCDTVVYTRQIVPENGIQCQAIVNQPTCFDSNNGSITLQPVSGSFPYTYLWQNGDTSAQLINIPTGVYAATVTDNAGCTFKVQQALTSLYKLEASLHPIPDCSNAGFGSISVSINTNIPDSLTWNWSNGAISKNLYGINAGTYTVTVSDQNTCSSSKTVIVENKSTMLPPSQLVSNGVEAKAIYLKWAITPCVDSVVVNWKLKTNTNWSSKKLSGSADSTKLINLLKGREYEIFLTNQNSSELLYSDTIIVSTLDTFFYDNDLDGFGNDSFSLIVAPGIKNLVEIDGDCNDVNPWIYPEALEYCDSLDNNCNGQIDDGILLCKRPLNFVVSNVSDNSVSFSWDQSLCASGYLINWKKIEQANWVEVTLTSSDSTFTLGDLDQKDSLFCIISTNCNGTFSNWSDTLKVSVNSIPTIINLATYTYNFLCFNPDIIEVCNGMDENCNGLIDEGAFSNKYYDADHDGFGNETFIYSIGCSASLGFSVLTGDCDDTNHNIYPTKQEVCSNGIDDNCNNQIDEAGNIQAYLDTDNDGFGTGEPISLCEIIAGFSLNNCDCNDAIAAINPTALEISNNMLDDDCNGIIDDACTKNVNMTFIKTISINPTTILILIDKVNDATNYAIRYKPFGATNWIVKTFNTERFLLNNLSPATQYTFAIKTKCASVFTNYGISSTFTTAASSGICTKPIIKSIKQVSNTSAIAYWNFTYNANKYLLRYRINQPGSTWIIKTTPNNLSTELKLDFLTPGQSYIFQVAAYCQSGTSQVLSPYSSLTYYTHLALPPTCQPIVVLSKMEKEEEPMLLEPNDAQVKLFPNPTDGSISLMCEQRMSSCTLVDITKKSVQNWIIGTDQFTLDLEHLPSGMYILHVMLTDGSWVTQKIIRK
jgi:Putative metal-binding motif/SprB repeat/Secretion system C-terminal sorting domain